MSPWAPPRVCSAPRCPNLGECPLHGRKAKLRDYNRGRQPTIASYQTPPWRATRRMVLDRDVLCTWGSLPRDPQGGDRCDEEATDCAHVVPRSAGGDDSPENCRGLCRRHHSAETSRFESWNRR